MVAHSSLALVAQHTPQPAALTPSGRQELTQEEGEESVLRASCSSSQESAAHLGVHVGRV